MKIKIINLILLLNLLNKNLNSMQSNNIKELENIEQNLSLTSYAEYLTLSNFPEEIIQLIIGKIIENYISQIKHIDNIFELYSIEIKKIRKKLTKKLFGLSLTSKKLNHSVRNFIEYSIEQMPRMIKEKEKKLMNDIIIKYQNIDRNTLNFELKLILNKYIGILNNYIGNRNALEKATMLIIAGANIETKNNFGNTVLTLAIQYGYKNVAKLFLNLLNQKNIPVNLNTYNYTSSLMIAVSLGHKEIIELLLDIGIDINTTDPADNNALIMAVFFGHKEIVKLVLDRGADINAKNSEGETALMLAKKSNFNDIAELIEKYQSKNN